MFTHFLFNVYFLFIKKTRLQIRHQLASTEKKKKKILKTYDTKPMVFDMWHLTHDTWQVTGGRRWTFSHNISSLALTVWDLLLTFDIWQVPPDTWHMTWYTWHITHVMWQQEGGEHFVKISVWNKLCFKY